jgi:hypothetical protein
MDAIEADLRDRLVEACVAFTRFRNRRDELLRHAYWIPDEGTPGHECAAATLILDFVGELERLSLPPDNRVGQMADFMAELRHRAGAINPLEAGAATC